jgi:hypothetical protein
MGALLEKKAIEQQVPYQIAELDLSDISQRLMNKTREKSLSAYECELGELTYKRFLALQLLYPSSNLVPPAIADIFWHEHILDTKKYASDCELIFGTFLHHTPWLQSKASLTDEKYSIAQAESQALFERHFGMYGSLFDFDINLPNRSEDYLNQEVNSFKASTCSTESST